MKTSQLASFGPLAVRVKEQSLGLFYWTITQLSADEHIADVCISASDHPYPSHEAAKSAGVACLKALKMGGERGGTPFNLPVLPSLHATPPILNRQSLNQTG
jgi:hypothetical protein